VSDNAKTKSRLSNLDALYENEAAAIPSESLTPTIKKVPTTNLPSRNKKEISYEFAAQLTSFKGHPFRLYEGERLNDMVESIRAKGVIVPIIVRRIGDVLEILSGHNRVEASKLAGITEIPTIILENVTDADALAVVIETNLLQRSFSDMSHSEKAAVLALHHSKMFSQGKRNDIIEKLQMLEKPHETGVSESCAQVAHKLKSRDIVAKEYGLSKDTVARYLRVNQLISSLKIQLDNGNIAFMSAVMLSHLSDTEQKLLADCIEKHNLPVDMKKADMLRKCSEKSRLDKDSIYRILSGAMAHKPSRTPTVKISKTVFVKYFDFKQSSKEIQGIVEEALAFYHEHKGITPTKN